MAGPTAKPRLAIVSTYGDLCGIAAYTHYLSKQLSNDFDVEILPLNQHVLHAMHWRVRRLGNAHIQDLAARLKDFDFVNLQFEHGTLGMLPIDIYNRFETLLKAVPGLSITMHTVIPSEPHLYSILGNMARLRLKDAYQHYQDLRRESLLGDRLAGLIKSYQKRKPISVIMHTRRDKRVMMNEHELRNVYDHPLAFHSPSDAAAIRAKASRASFPTLANVPSDAKLVGVFGFISRYKNTQLLVRTMPLLPKNYHLLVFGGVHPNEIRKREPINEYLEEVLFDTDVGISSIDKLTRNQANAAKAGHGKADIALSINSSRDLQDIVAPMTSGLFERVHFMGAMDDPGFFEGMCICDSVVIPYLEVGQTSSGPISQALELDCRVLAARNKAFMQLEGYHPETLEFFDIGNYVELAQRLMSAPQYPVAGRRLRYNTATNIAVYRAANNPNFPEPETSTAMALEPAERLKAAE